MRKLVFAIMLLPAMQPPAHAQNSALPTGTTVLYYEKSSGKCSELSGTFNKKTDQFENGKITLSTDRAGLVYEITTNGTKQKNPAAVTFVPSTNYQLSGTVKPDVSSNELFAVFTREIVLTAAYDINFSQNAKLQNMNGEAKLNFKLVPVDQMINGMNSGCIGDTIRIFQDKRDAGITVTPKFPPDLQYIDRIDAVLWYEWRVLAKKTGEFTLPYDVEAGTLKTKQTAKVKVYSGVSATLPKNLKLKVGQQQTVTIPTNDITSVSLYSEDAGLDIRRDSFNFNTYYFRATEAGSYRVQATMYGCVKPVTSQFTVLAADTNVNPLIPSVSIDLRDDILLLGKGNPATAKVNPRGGRVKWKVTGDLEIEGADTLLNISINAKKHKGNGTIYLTAYLSNGDSISTQKYVTIGPVFEMWGIYQAIATNISYRSVWDKATETYTYYVQKTEKFNVMYKVKPDVWNIKIETSSNLKDLGAGFCPYYTCQRFEAVSNGAGWVKFTYENGPAKVEYKLNIVVIEVKTLNVTGTVANNGTVASGTKVDFTVQFLDVDGNDVTDYVDFRKTAERKCPTCSRNNSDDNPFLFGHDKTFSVTMTYKSKPTQYWIFVTTSLANLPNGSLLNQPHLSKLQYYNVSAP